MARNCSDIDRTDSHADHAASDVDPTGSNDNHTTANVNLTDLRDNHTGENAESSKNPTASDAAHSSFATGQTPGTEDRSTAVNRSNRLLGEIGLSAAITVIAGPVGTVLTIAGIAGARFAPGGAEKPCRRGWSGDRCRRSGAVHRTVACPGGYMGGSLWVQVPALIAVIAVGVAALTPRKND